MTSRVLLFEHSHEFLDRAESLLMEDEVANSLILGVVAAIARQTHGRRRHRPLFALVEERGEPVVAAAWTLPHKVLLSGHVPVTDHSLDQLNRHLRQARRDPEVIFGPDTVAHRSARLWADAAGRRVVTGMQQRLFVLRAVRWPDEMAAGSLVPAVLWNRDLLGQWVESFQAEAVPAEATDRDTALLITDRLLTDENLYIWLAEPDGGEEQPVSMAARARPTQHGTAINLVYTPPEFRRRGYASATVAHLSHQILVNGWEFCTLFTDLSNPTSNHIYETIGYSPVVDYTEYRLTAAP
jgi:GNAT superfamily N-acetyltransferase